MENHGTGATLLTFALVIIVLWGGVYCLAMAMRFDKAYLRISRAIFITPFKKGAKKFWKKYKKPLLKAALFIIVGIIVALAVTQK